MSTPNLLGIEIGGTKLQLGLGTGLGSIDALIQRVVDPEAGAAAIRDQIEQGYLELSARCGHDRVAAAAIGFGGPVDPRRGTVVQSNQVGGWKEFPICSWLSETLQIRPVVLQNDSDAAALAEARFGAGRGHSPLLYVNSGSGVGGGLVVEGAVYSGSGIGALEIGHLWVAESPTPKTLEQVASGWAIAQAGRTLIECTATRDHERSSRLLSEMTAGDPSRVTCELVAQAALRGDPRCHEIYRRATLAMGRALAHAATLLAPRRIVLGGGVAQSPLSLWLEPIAEEIERRVFPSFRGTFDLVPAALGQEVVVHGALALAADAWRRLVSG
jgi:glucokinase